MKKKKLEMFFDYECPYCLKGYNDLLELLEARDDIELEWRPCEAHPRPETHGLHSDLCIRGLFYVQAHGGDVMEYHRRMYKAAVTDGADIENPEVIAAVADGVVPGDALLTALNDGLYQDKLAEANDYAYEENDVWFLPVFRCEGRRIDAEGGVGVTKQQIADVLG